MSDLGGQIALITGAGGTLGSSHARAIAAKGAHVIVHDIDEGAAQSVVENILEGAQGSASPMVCDITNGSAVKAEVSKAVNDHGEITILINNAGITGNNALLKDIDEAFFDRMFDIHVKGAFFAIQSVIGGMKSVGRGRIVNTISGRAHSGAVSGSHYNGAKGAIVGLTRALATEFAPFGITVNAIAPGVTPSGMTRARLGEDGLAARAKQLVSDRLPTPEEITSGVMFFLAEEAAIVTGRVLNMQQPRKAEVV
ncbi:MAG: 3-oxoacyl-ACP reductase [Rhodospirillaceae bacterium]|nr:3-oxoacyl-ACP reductase [Rhodospirillaceae bacterium]|tara:strand:- start:5970 stop:6731 length:762 start_codon:yes stop_codon:yes gene_type:complete